MLAGARLDRVDGAILALGTLAFALVAFAVLDDYGLSWDEVDNFVVGDALVDAILARDLHVYLRTEVTGGLLRYPPVANFVAGVTSEILHERLGVLGWVDAHHVAVVLFGALGVPAVFLLARPWGRAAGAIAMIAYAAHPVIFAQSHLNVKDLPLAVLLAWTVLFAVRWLDGGSFRDGAFAAALLALAANVKPSALLAPLFLGLALLGARGDAIARGAKPFARALVAWARGPWRPSLWTLALLAQLSLLAFLAWTLVRAQDLMRLSGPWRDGFLGKPWGWPLVFVVLLLTIPATRFFVRARDEPRKDRLPVAEANALHAVRDLLLDGTLLAAVAFAVLLLSWPLLWTAPTRNALLAFEYFTTVGDGYHVWYFGEAYVNGVDRPWHYAPVMLAITTPLLVLAGAAIGTGVALRDAWRATPRALLGAALFYWATVPVARVILPKAFIYDGARHLLDVSVALTVLAGIGLAGVARLAGRWRVPGGERAAAVGIAAIVLVADGGLAAAMHPFGLSYYNALVGGPEGATDRFDMAWWGEGVRPAVRWLNVNAPANATVNVLLAGHLAYWEGLRSDLTLLGGVEEVGGRLVYSGDFVVSFPRYSSIYTRGPGVPEGSSARDVWEATRDTLPLAYEEVRLGVAMVEIRARAPSPGEAP